MGRHGKEEDISLVLIGFQEGNTPGSAREKLTLKGRELRLSQRTVRGWNGVRAVYTQGIEHTRICQGLG